MSSVSENNDKELLQRQKTFNGLSASEWASMSSSVWNDVSSPRAKKHLNHGATYPEKLCDRLITMYSHVGDIILDPFLGTGTTVVSAMKNERKSIGIELTDRFYEVANESVTEYYNSNQMSLFEDKTFTKPVLYKGDCLDIIDKIEDNSVQLTLTSPPYADLIHKVVEDRAKCHKKSKFVLENNATTNLYSEDDRDLGNMPIEKYIPKVEDIMQKLYKVTKTGGYNIWIVKDFRNTKEGIPYIDLHSKIAMAGEKAGFKYHDLIIWDQNQHRKLVLLGYPSVFYVNQNHSYIVVMRKPN